MHRHQKGRGASFNPKNRFLKQSLEVVHPEGVDEPLIDQLVREVIEEHPKQIVNRVDSPDLNMPYSLNPYQGCEHGCIYCYARNSHQYWGYSAGLDFESKIIVKKNAPELLEKHFQKRTWQPAPISLSGNTDCYQPIEREMGITRRLLERFLAYGNPVGIITKNRLILRDLDLLKELARERLVHVFISLTTLNETLRRQMEPRTVTGEARLQVVQTLAEAKIPVGVMCAPIIPGLNNYEIPELLKRAAQAGAQEAAYTVVRLNDAVKDLFSDWLERHFPERKEKVSNQIAALHGGRVNDSAWGRRLKGEGNYADGIRTLFQMNKKKYFSGRSLPDYDLGRFRRTPNLRLF